MTSAPVAPHPNRAAVILTRASLIVAALGAVPFLALMVAASARTPHGEIEGGLFMLTVLYALGILTFAAIVGLTLAIAARRRGARTRAVTLALLLNGLALLAVLIVVLINVIYAAAA